MKIPVLSPPQKAKPGVHVPVKIGGYFLFGLIFFSVLFCLTQRAPAQKGPEIDPKPKTEEKKTSSGIYLNRIKARGKVIIGLQSDYHPFHIENPRENYPGIDMEIGKLLADGLGVQIEYKFYSLPELLEAVKTGTIDLSLGGISSSLERSRTINFTQPYLVTTPAGLLSKNSLPPESEGVDFPRREYTSLADLNHLGRLILGVKANTTNELILRTKPEFANHTIKPFLDRSELLIALESGKIDVMVADGVYIKALILKKSDLLSRFIPLTKNYQEEHICIALPQGDPEYWQYLDFFVKELKRSGTMDNLLKKYFDSDEWIKRP